MCTVEVNYLGGQTQCWFKFCTLRLFWKLDCIAINDSNYSLPVAQNSPLILLVVFKFSYVLVQAFMEQ